MATWKHRIEPTVAWLVNKKHSIMRASIMAALLMGLCRCGSITSAQPPGSFGDHPYVQRIPAPRLNGPVNWVNVADPKEVADLRGRFVLLDFWTYCCINCMHILPELKQLEQAYPEELVVVGVHSAKFDGEEDSQNIREAIARYEIEHPVINDANQAIWKLYGAKSWPTFVLIDPVGEVVWAASGERKFEDIKAVIDRGLPYYRRQGLLKPAPRPKLLEDPTMGHTPLRFPGKVLADEAGGRLFIADSNHNRIVVSKLDGTLEYLIGSGEIGRADGSFESSSFNHPQGLALVGDTLYVADTENHLLRKVDLIEKKVTTIAGTGEKGNGWPGSRKNRVPNRFVGRPKATALASPWALWPHDGELYIAMAGPHLIWRMPLTATSVSLYAGNGREDIVDGPLVPETPYQPGFASFAQPSGFASDGDYLFVADSEGSAIRAVPFDQKGRVETLVGPTGTLFDFGDRDGVGPNVRLQHPLGVAFADGKLYVADTYNNKIKVIEVAERHCRTLAGAGTPGSADAYNGAQATFNEPGGLAVAGGKLYVADTNNHAIRVVNLAAPHEVTTLEIAGLESP